MGDLRLIKLYDKDGRELSGTVSIVDEKGSLLFFADVPQGGVLVESGLFVAGNVLNIVSTGFYDGRMSLSSEYSDLDIVLIKKEQSYLWILAGALAGLVLSQFFKPDRKTF